VRDCIQVNRNNQGFAPQTRSGKRSLTAGMTRPDHYYVIFSGHFRIRPEIDPVLIDLIECAALLDHSIADETRYAFLPSLISGTICCLP
jgi:hypothetical protein